jgi:PIN domain nuclease of toxin-antitoxin system
VDRARPFPSGREASAGEVILLDTNAVLFLSADHRRARPLKRQSGQLYFTPFALLEMQFLQEAGRGRFTSPAPMEAVKQDPRWSVDDPPVDGVVARAIELTWTRDPFDRLIAAHALYRGWRLATSDTVMIRNLPAGVTFPL